MIDYMILGGIGSCLNFRGYLSVYFKFNSCVKSCGSSDWNFRYDDKIEDKEGMK